jgi:hypothetical protein
MPKNISSVIGHIRKVCAIAFVSSKTIKFDNGQYRSGTRVVEINRFFENVPAPMLAQVF